MNQLAILRASDDGLAPRDLELLREMNEKIMDTYYIGIMLRLVNGEQLQSSQLPHPSLPLWLHQTYDNDIILSTTLIRGNLSFLKIKSFLAFQTLYNMQKKTMLLIGFSEDSHPKRQQNL